MISPGMQPGQPMPGNAGARVSLGDGGQSATTPGTTSTSGNSFVGGGGSFVGGGSSYVGGGSVTGSQPANPGRPAIPANPGRIPARLSPGSRERRSTHKAAECLPIRFSPGRTALLPAFPSRER